MPKQPRTSKNAKKSGKDSKGSEIKYATGFKPPNAEQIKKAIGFTKGIPIEYQYDKKLTGTEFFQPIPKPEHMDDWLAQYNEEGQSYTEFTKECPWLSSRKRKFMSQTFLPSAQTLPQKYPDGKIYIVPVGNFDQEDSSFYTSLIEYTQIFLGLPVISLPKINLAIDNGEVYWVEEEGSKQSSGRRSSHRTIRHKLTSRFDRGSGRFQVQVDSHLMKLRSTIPPDAICMIGLTMFDLYGDDTDLFVAGMAAGNERVAIFSLYRYDPCLSFSKEFWYKVMESEVSSHDERLGIILQRSCKLLVHEIGHLLGLAHCIYFDCCMNGSGHLKEDFRQPMHLCPVDLHKLQSLIGFDVIERYRSLQKFYKREGFLKEEQWVQGRIEFIEKES